MVGDVISEDGKAAAKLEAVLHRIEVLLRVHEAIIDAEGLKAMVQTDEGNYVFCFVCQLILINVDVLALA